MIGLDPFDPHQPGDSRTNIAISRHRLINLLHNHRVELLAAICLLYIVLGTLIPFDFRWTAQQERGFGGLGNVKSGLPDLLSNIALYVPLGVLFHLSLTRSIGHPWIAIVAATITAAAVSASCELLQILSPTRVSSITDFLANVAGAFIGASAACIGGGITVGWCRSFSSKLRNQPRSAVVQAYVILLIVVGLAPYTPTADITRLVRSARQSTLEPFQQDRALDAALIAAVASDNDYEVASLQRDRMLLWAGRTAELLSFVILGCLLGELLGAFYQFRLATALALTLYLSISLAVLLSCLQFLIVTRGFHATDLLIRALGALLGGSASLLFRQQSANAAGRARAEPWRVARTASWIVAGFVVFMALAPFAFEFDTGQITNKINSPAFLPFYSYAAGRFDVTSADLCGKVIRFGLLGAFAWLGWRNSRDQRLGRAALTIAGWVAAICAVTEVVQLFITTRVPSLTDPIVALIAAWTGAVLAQYSSDFVRFAYQGRRAIHAPAAPAVMTLTDQLIASLIPDESPQPSRHQATAKP